MKQTIFFLLSTIIACSSLIKYEKPHRFIGLWEKQEIFTPWMSSKQQKFLNTVLVSERPKGYFMEIEINGHHSCSIGAYVETNNETLVLDTSFPLNKNLDLNTEESNPCVLKLQRKGKKLSIISDSPGCSSSCGGSNSFKGKEFSQSLNKTLPKNIASINDLGLRKKQSYFSAKQVLLSYKCKIEDLSQISCKQENKSICSLGVECSDGKYLKLSIDTSNNPEDYYIEELAR